MATLVNKLNREVKVIIPNMREFRVFYSDDEGSVMFFKRDWKEETTKKEEHWRPNENQMAALWSVWTGADTPTMRALGSLLEDLRNLILM